LYESAKWNAVNPMSEKPKFGKGSWSGETNLTLTYFGIDK